MTIQSVCDSIEQVAPLALQETYDNAGLLVGNPLADVKGVLVCIDVTEPVVDEAILKGCNLIVSHHPLIFSGLKKLTGRSEVERCVIKAIKNDIAVYAAHTNIDNVLNGVNGKIADKLGLINRRILQPKTDVLLKLVTYVPHDHIVAVRQALFTAGAGHIGNYDSCSFNMEGMGTFRAGSSSTPFVGKVNEFHTEPEIRLEVVVPAYRKANVITALLNAHPYEEPVYDLVPIKNTWEQVGAGVIGELAAPAEARDFLEHIKLVFGLKTLKHTSFLNEKISKVAVCGGSGSSLLSQAIASKADIFISGDFKYHEFFSAENKILIADIGHFESEQFTKEIFYEIITKKMSTFAVRISEINTNPITYL